MHSLQLVSIGLAGVLSPALATPLSARADTKASAYCAGTEYDASMVDTYICGDKRLGPVVFPQDPPLDSALESYDRFGGLTPQQFLEKWWDPDYANRDGSKGAWKYPPQEGFSLDISVTSFLPRPIAGNLELTNGTLVDRFGGESGRFLGAYGAPYIQRALPPDNLDTPQTDPV